MRDRDYYPAVKWKPIHNFESYKIGNNGVVLNSHDKPLKPLSNKKGYLKVYLNSESVKHKQYFIHRLVANAFIPNPSNLPYINHKDECKQNNNWDNLEWCNNTYNQRYSHALKVNQYDIFGNFIRSWDAISDIERSLGFAATNISKCCKGLIKTSNGYIFLYEEDSIQQRLIELKERKHKGKIESKIYELQ